MTQRCPPGKRQLLPTPRRLRCHTPPPRIDRSRQGGIFLDRRIHRKLKPPHKSTNTDNNNNNKRDLWSASEACGATYDQRLPARLLVACFPKQTRREKLRWAPASPSQSCKRTPHRHSSRAGDLINQLFYTEIQHFCTSGTWHLWFQW